MLTRMELNVRLANPPIGLVAKYTRKEREFFFNYSDYVLSLFNRPEVQGQLRSLLETESIRINRFIDLRIMAFPARPLHGRPRNTLHGSYNHDSAQISIYPMRMNRNWVRREGHAIFRTPPSSLTLSQRETLREVCLSALSTLIHEILHVKFESRGLSRYSEEAIVRKLERQYAEEWMRNMPADLAESPLPVMPSQSTME